MAFLVRAWLVSAAWFMVSIPLHASTIDNMNNASGFFNSVVVERVGNQNVDDPVGYLLPTATADSNGTVTLADIDAHSDTTEEILDWRMPGGSLIPFMDLTANRFLQLNLTSVNSGRQYGVNILFFGPGSSNPAFLSEGAWITGGNGSDLHPSLDVDSLAPNGAGQYFVRFRLLAPNQAGNVLSINSIVTTAIPEPGSLALGISGLGFLMFLKWLLKLGLLTRADVDLNRAAIRVTGIS